MRDKLQDLYFRTVYLLTLLRQQEGDRYLIVLMGLGLLAIVLTHTLIQMPVVGHANLQALVEIGHTLVTIPVTLGFTVLFVWVYLRLQG